MNETDSGSCVSAEEPKSTKYRLRFGRCTPAVFRWMREMDVTVKSQEELADVMHWLRPVCIRRL